MCTEGIQHQYRKAQKLGLKENIFISTQTSIVFNPLYSIYCQQCSEIIPHPPASCHYAVSYTPQLMVVAAMW